MSDKELRAARAVARWLDRLYLDPILGLVLPGAGDVLTGAAGLYLVVLGLRLRLPPVVIARMLLNLAIDMLVGVIPLVGDAFDLAFRANERNLALLEKRAASAGKASAGDWLAVAGALLLFLGALAAPVLLVVWALRKVF